MPDYLYLATWGGGKNYTAVDSADVEVFNGLEDAILEFRERYISRHGTVRLLTADAKEVDFPLVDEDTTMHVYLVPRFDPELGTLPDEPDYVLTIDRATDGVLVTL